MKASIEHGNGIVYFDLSHPVDISIPIRFDATGSLAFGAPPAQKTPLTVENFTGNTAQGGSCNCDVLTIVPHTQGTHTECIGHMTDDDYTLPDVFSGGLFVAEVISIQPEKASESADTYNSSQQPGDNVITRACLEKHHDKLANKAAIVLRAGAHSNMPPYFSREAMSYLAGLEIQHLLIDTPSVDRLDDNGELLIHRIYWNLRKTGHDAGENPRTDRTITELIHVPENVNDGTYVLNLQVCALGVDAVPSRPLLYEVTNHD